MQPIFVFLDITKVDSLRWKNAWVSKTEELCHVVYMFFGSSLGKVKGPSVSSPQKVHPE